MIISPKRHVNELHELSDTERNEIFLLINKTIKILKDNNITDSCILTFDERKHIHFHVCIVPKYDWMTSLTNDIAGDLKKIMEYSKQIFTTQKDFDEIKAVSDIVAKNLK